MEDRKQHLEILFGIIIGVIALFIVIRLFAVPISENLTDSLKDDEVKEDDTTDSEEEDELIDIPSVSYVMGTPLVSLNGDSVITVQYGTVYEELGAVATDTKYGNISSDIVVTGKVDTSVIGTYFVNYSVKNADGVVASITRQVNVSDMIGPEFNLNSEVGDDIIVLDAAMGMVFDDSSYFEYSDNLGGDVTILRYFYYKQSLGDGYYAIDMNQFLLATPGYYRVYYVAMDEYGNRTELDRYLEFLVIDSVKPVLTATMGNLVNIELNSSINESDYYSASDNIKVAKASAYKYEYSTTLDGIYNVVDVVSLPTDKIGYYKVTYSAVDTSNNISDDLVITYHVSDTTKPVISVLSNVVELEMSSISTILDDTNYYTISDNDSTPVRISKVYKTSLDGINYVVSAISEIDISVEGYYMVDYTVSDATGNSSVFSIKYRVVDTSSLAEVSITSILDSTVNNKYDFSIVITDNYDDIKNFEYVFVTEVPTDFDTLTNFVSASVEDVILPSITLLSGDIYYLVVKAVDSHGNVTYKVSDSIIGS